MIPNECSTATLARHEPEIDCTSTRCSRRSPPWKETARALAADLGVRCYEIGTMKSLTRALCWTGLAASVFLIGLGVWCHFNLDAIIRIPFVFMSVGGGLMISLYSLGYLLKR